MPYTCAAPTKGHYRLTNSVDGIERLSFRIDYRLTLHDMATLITSWCGSDFQNFYGEVRQDAVDATITSKAAAIKLAKDCLYSDGMETPPYRVGDNHWEPARDAVLAKLEALWS